MDAIYNVAIVSYLADGGDGNKWLKEDIIERQRGIEITFMLRRVQVPFISSPPSKFSGPLDLDVMKSYLAKMSPVMKGVENRIKIFRSDHVDYVFSEANRVSATTAVFLVFILSFLS